MLKLINYSNKVRFNKLILLNLKTFSTKIDSNYSNQLKHGEERYQHLKNNQIELYPNYHHSNPKRTSIESVIEIYNPQVQPGTKLENVELVVTGRVKSIRAMSKKLTFVDLVENKMKLQLMVKRNETTDPLKDISLWDNIEVKGIIGKTKVGELSLFVNETPKLLSPCLQKVPDWKGVKEVSVKLRNRTLELLSNPVGFKAIQTRFLILKYLRNYLNDLEFLEVETPILNPQTGGANATPFLTESKALNSNLQLRISPELFLKQLICSGFPKVYELGKVFRNEGIDNTHHPEFTSLEFYSTYWNLEDLIQFTEKLFNDMVLEFNNNSNIIQTVNGTKITFSPKFDRIHVVSTLEEKLGEPLPDYFGDVNPFIDLCRRHSVPIKAPFTVNRLLDQLIGHYIEPMCINPTFLIGHPITMSPLAKTLSNQPLLSARFELFINGQEFVNAYEELNDPVVQRDRFMQQVKDRQLGDSEAQSIDENFIDSLMYGLPPTGGWGLGVDRLIALLTQTKNIRDTIVFPLVNQSKQ